MSDATDAFRRMLQREEMKQFDAERASGAGLRSVMSRIDHFLAEASTAPPPVCLEVTTHPSVAEGEDASGPSPAHEEVQLNIVAGVLEPRQAPASLRSASHGLLLPTAENEQALDAERMRESQALLHLFSTLCGRDEPVRNRGEDAADCSTSSSEVDIMDATSGSDDDDEPPAARKRLITEL